METINRKVFIVIFQTDFGRIQSIDVLITDEPEETFNHKEFLKAHLLLFFKKNLEDWSDTVREIIVDNLVANFDGLIENFLLDKGLSLTVTMQEPTIGIPDKWENEE